ncbi:MAG: hypothetical protein ACE5G0_21280 [Rhodothermales bacterium]
MRMWLEYPGINHHGNGHSCNTYDISVRLDEYALGEVLVEFRYEDRLEGEGRGVCTVPRDIARWLGYALTTVAGGYEGEGVRLTVRVKDEQAGDFRQSMHWKKP